MPAVVFSSKKYFLVLKGVMLCSRVDIAGEFSVCLTLYKCLWKMYGVVRLSFGVNVINS